MGKLICELLDKKIDCISKNVEVYGIILIGSCTNKDLNSPVGDSDIDIFVIKKEGEFKREVGLFEGVEFDVSYISLEELKYGLDNRIPSLVTIISKAKKIYGDDEISKLIEYAFDIYQKGPKKLTEYEVDYKRFVFTDALEQLSKRSEQEEFSIMYYCLMKDIIKFYYKAEHIWMPPDKRLLKFIQDSNILDIVGEINKADNRVEKIKLLDKLLSTILEKHGGKLNEWKYGSYPFDFE